MEGESLQDKILPSNVSDISNRLDSELADAAAANAKILTDKSLGTTKSFITKMLEGAQSIINSNHFIIWVVILFSSFLYDVFNGLRGSFPEMLSKLLNGNMLFSLFVLSGIYAWSDYMPDSLNISSKKITFIPYRYNNNNSRSREGFINKPSPRRKLEVY
jgi:hypothetical protein